MQFVNFSTGDTVGKKIAELKLKLSVSDDDARQIELETKGQRNNKRWFEVRRLWLTASYFSQVRRLRDQTPPDNLVLQILGVKRIGRSIAMQWRIDHKDVAMQYYVKFQQNNGHTGLYACTTGIYVPPLYSFLATSPDGAVYITATLPCAFLK